MDKENADVVKAAGFNNSYNTQTTYLTSANIKLQVWATYQSGTTYKIATQFDWLSHPTETAVLDMLALSNDTKATRQQNTSSFFVNADIYHKTIQGGSTFSNIENVVPATTSAFKQEITGIGCTYTVPSRYLNITSQSWDERVDLRGYLSYNISVPTPPNSYGVLGSYGHQKTYTTWNTSVGVSFPAGITFASWPSGASNTDTTSVYTNFTVT